MAELLTVTLPGHRLSKSEVSFYSSSSAPFFSTPGNCSQLSLIRRQSAIHAMSHLFVIKDYLLTNLAWYSSLGVSTRSVLQKSSPALPSSYLTQRLLTCRGMRKNKRGYAKAISSNWWVFHPCEFWLHTVSYSILKSQELEHSIHSQNIHQPPIQCKSICITLRQPPGY